MISRLDRLREVLKDKGLGAFLVTSLPNARYLTGFSGSNALVVVTADRCVLVTDPRYGEQAALQAVGCEVLVSPGRMIDAVIPLLKPAFLTGFENSIPFALHRELDIALPEGSELRPEEGIVESLRAVKDGCELHLMREAARCSAEALDSAMALLEPGTSERRLAAELDYRMTLAGADGPAFKTIVASGPNSALPHAGVTDRVFNEGDTVVVDFGARFEGYCCDVTRTFCIGRPSDRVRRLIDILAGASQAAMQSLRPGVPAVEVDTAARQYLDARGLGTLFSHGLGHGVGLQEHEKPSLSKLSADNLEPGMVFTVEPGMYIKGDLGVRHEETVLMTADGPEILTEIVRGGPAG